MSAITTVGYILLFAFCCNVKKTRGVVCITESAETYIGNVGNAYTFSVSSSQKLLFKTSRERVSSVFISVCVKFNYS